MEDCFLPDEIWKYVLGYLPISSLGTVSRINKRWYGYSNWLWTSINLQMIVKSLEDGYMKGNDKCLLDFGVDSFRW